MEFGLQEAGKDKGRSRKRLLDREKTRNRQKCMHRRGGKEKQRGGQGVGLPGK